jgi:hypothetical protein
MSVLSSMSAAATSGGRPKWNNYRLQEHEMGWGTTWLCGGSKAPVRCYALAVYLFVTHQADAAYVYAGCAFAVFCTLHNTVDHTFNLVYGGCGSERFPASHCPHREPCGIRAFGSGAARIEPSDIREPSGRISL